MTTTTTHGERIGTEATTGEGRHGTDAATEGRRMIVVYRIGSGAIVSSLHRACESIDCVGTIRFVADGLNIWLAARFDEITPEDMSHFENQLLIDGIDFARLQ